MRLLISSSAALAAAAVLGLAGAAHAQQDTMGTVVPGQANKADQDGNGIPDAGVFVNGHYTSLYAEDANGDYYWDLGDGRVYATVSEPADLDQSTVVSCDYIVNFRADFGNDPFMDTGRIMNNIQCDDGTHFKYLIVHEDDKQYTGTGIPVWGTWEYKVITESGKGNIANPARTEVFAEALAGYGG